MAETIVVLTVLTLIGVVGLAIRADRAARVTGDRSRERKAMDCVETLNALVPRITLYRASADKSAERPEIIRQVAEAWNQPSSRWRGFVQLPSLTFAEVRAAYFQGTGIDGDAIAMHDGLMQRFDFAVQLNPPLVRGLYASLVTELSASQGTSGGLPVPAGFYAVLSPIELPPTLDDLPPRDEGPLYFGPFACCTQAVNFVHDLSTLAARPGEPYDRPAERVTHRSEWRTWPAFEALP